MMMRQRDGILDPPAKKHMSFHTFQAISKPNLMNVIKFKWYLFNNIARITLKRLMKRLFQATKLKIIQKCFQLSFSQVKCIMILISQQDVSLIQQRSSN